MKTAKEVCEEIKNRDVVRLQNKVDAYIELVRESANGVRILSDYVHRYGNTKNQYISRDYYITDFTDDVEAELIKLGYKVGHGAKHVKLEQLSPKFETIPAKKILGFIPIRHEHQKHVGYETTYTDDKLRTLTISACCGEE